MNHCPSPANTGATPVAIAGLQNLALLDNSKDAPLAADVAFLSTALQTVLADCTSVASCDTQSGCGVAMDAVIAGCAFWGCAALVGTTSTAAKTGDADQVFRPRAPARFLTAAPDSRGNAHGGQQQCRGEFMLDDGTGHAALPSAEARMPSVIRSA